MMASALPATLQWAAFLLYCAFSIVCWCHALNALPLVLSRTRKAIRMVVVLHVFAGLIALGVLV